MVCTLIFTNILLSLYTTVCMYVCMNTRAPGILKVVYKGYPDERKRIFKEDVENGQLNVLITTYEYTMRDKSSLKRLTWQYIIVDEGHRMKNANVCMLTHRTMILMSNILKYLFLYRASLRKLLGQIILQNIESF